MLRIAFCDDETEILEELESLTEQYCADRGCRMEYQAFHSPLELLAAMEKGTYFDAVFLDVLMPGENGISTARELRKTDQNITEDSSENQLLWSQMHLCFCNLCIVRTNITTRYS